jgi:hypothetical protein
VRPCADWIARCEKGILDGVKCETDINLVNDGQDMFGKVKLLGEQKKTGQKVSASSGSQGATDPIEAEVGGEENEASESDRIAKTANTH